MFCTFLPIEISEELELDCEVQSGYYWIEDRSIVYWNPREFGTLEYKGSLTPFNVCNRLNEESKKVFSSYMGQMSFEFHEDEDKIKAIVRVRKELGLGLREAKNLVEGNYTLPSCVVIEGGPLNNTCMVSYQYIPIDVLNVIPLPITCVIKFSNEDLWELDCSDYRYSFILLRSINTSTYIQAFKSNDGCIKYELGNEDRNSIVYKGDLYTCLDLSNQFQNAYMAGQKKAALKFFELSNSLLKEY